MAIQTIHDTGVEHDIMSIYDGALYDTAINNDCIVRGVGDEFKLNSNGTSLNVSFNAGSEAVIGGSFFKLTSNVSVPLVPNKVIYLCATIDLEQANGTRGIFTQRTLSSMVKGNLNGGDKVRDFLMYIITTNGSGVTDVIDMRQYADRHIALTESEYNEIADSDKKNIFYYIYE